jgi:hypothetical protein
MLRDARIDGPAETKGRHSEQRVGQQIYERKKLYLPATNYESWNVFAHEPDADIICMPVTCHILWSEHSGHTLDTLLKPVF